MRILLALVIFTQIAVGQSNFKNIQFGNTTLSDQLPQAPKNLKLVKNQDRSQALDYRPLNLSGFPSNMIAGPLDYAQLDHHSFWAESHEKINFNLRAANSSIASFLNQFKAKLQIKDISKEFLFESKETDDLGFQHIKVRQVYQEIPVYGGELIIHSKNESLNTVNGYVYPTPSTLNITANLSVKDAENILIQDLKSYNKFKEVSPEVLKLTKRERMAYEKNIFYDESEKAHLVYTISMMASGIETWVYFIDAHDGTILKKYKNTCSFLPIDHASSFISNHDHTHHTEMVSPLVSSKFSVKEDFFGKTTSNATDLFGKQLTLNTYQDGATYYLVDVTRQMFISIGADNEEPTGVIWTFDGKSSSPALQSFNPALVNAATNNSTWIGNAAASAHYNAGLAYEYYLNKHGRNSINGKGGNIISLVNIVEEDGKQMDNAFWDGEAMYYGNGKDAFSPLARAVDVAGHEMSHGVVQTTANLNYESESGALNESFADIFGRLIDRDDWGMGEDVVKKSVFPTGVLRSFIDPHNGGNQLNDAGYQPRIYSERYRGTEDNGGVHINSGIANWAFYQFTTRINNDLDKAEKIYYRALTRYLTRSSRFIDCRKAIIQSATDLYGTTSAEVTAAKAAYDFVGILDGVSTTTTTEVQTNTGTNYIVYTDDAQSALYLADETGRIVANPLSTKDPLSKPSVTDDGSAIIFVGKDKKIHYVIIDWKANTIKEEGVLQSEAIWRNAIISKKGNLMAAIKDVKENKIHVYDFNSEKWQAFDLYNPTFSNGVKTGAVNYADAMEFDHSGETIMYDASNTIKNAAGADVEYWDISFLRTYNNAKSIFGDGKVSKLFGQLPEKTSVGNPTFSKNSPYIIAMDYIVNFGASNESYLLVGANTETGKIDTIFTNGQINWPNYSTADDKVIFNAATSSGTKVIGQIKLTNTKIKGSGFASSLVSPGKLGTWFANAARVLPTAVENELVTKYGLKVSPNPVTDNYITVQWNQANAIDDTRFFIYDVAGKLRYTSKGKFGEGNQSFTIPVNELASGIYLMKMEIGGKSGSVKFVK